MEVQARITELLVNKYGVDPSKASPEATMAELGLDSLTVAELLFDIEDAFSIEISTDKADFSTLGEAAALVERLVSEQSP